MINIDRVTGLLVIISALFILVFVVSLLPGVSVSASNVQFFLLFAFTAIILTKHINKITKKSAEGKEKDNYSYIATLTHDLKTPTFAQLHAAELLLSGVLGDLNSDQKEIITQIKYSCTYMNELIFTILNSYLYDNGQNIIQQECFDIVELVRETSDELSNLLTAKGQQIRIYSGENQISVWADRFQIKRVLVNFIGNAMTYGLKNSVINISIKNKMSSVNLNVQNKCEYIPAGAVKSLFNKFSRTENAKAQKTGTGLGLYLSKQIIDAHNGRIYAKSDAKHNFDVGFDIPVIKDKNSKNFMTVLVHKGEQ